MKRELGIARCGLACCLCSENEKCHGCNSCSDRVWCKNRSCSLKKNLKGCYECNENCHEMMLKKIKPNAFTIFIRRYGIIELLDCLEKNEKNGVIYHRQGILGDYDDFNDIDELIDFIKTGVRK